MTDAGRKIEEQRKSEKPATLGYFYLVMHASANPAKWGLALWLDGNWYFFVVTSWTKMNVKSSYVSSYHCAFYFFLKKIKLHCMARTPKKNQLGLMNLGSLTGMQGRIYRWIKSNTLQVLNGKTIRNLRYSLNQ